MSLPPSGQFWQVRCWIAGRTYRRSTKTQSLRLAQSFARTVYEEWLAGNYQSVPDPTGATVKAPKVLQKGKVVTFGALATQLFANEEARQAVVIARLDNLGKGASGAAVQNIQLMLGV